MDFKDFAYIIGILVSLALGYKIGYSRAPFIRCDPPSEMNTPGVYQQMPKGSDQ